MIILLFKAIMVFVVAFCGCALLSFLMGQIHENDPVYCWVMACLLFAILATVVFITLSTPVYFVS